MYIYYYFFFFSLSLRFVTTGLVYLSAILVCRFCCLSPVFSIVSRSRLRRRLLSAEKHNGEQLLWRIVIFSTLFTQRVKVATNKRTKFSIQTFYSSAATLFKSDKVYFWLLLDEIDEIVPCCFSQMRIDRRLLLRYSRISTTVAIRSSRSGRARITATIVSLCLFIVVVGCFQNLDEQLWRSFWTRWI